METPSPHKSRGREDRFASPSPVGRKSRDRDRDPAGVVSALEGIDPSSPTSSAPSFDALRSFFLRVHPAAAATNRQLDHSHHDFQVKAKLVHDRLIGLINDGDHAGDWATFLLKWCVGLLGALDAKFATGAGQHTSIESHLGRLHNLYLASVIARCLAAMQAEDEQGDNETNELKQRELDGVKPLVWLMQFAARSPRSLEWLVAFAGLHYPQEVLQLLLASILQDVVEGKAGDPLSPSSSSSCFGVHAIEYLAHRHPQHCVDALRSYWTRFLSFSAAQHTPEDTHLLVFFALIVSACPTTTQLVLPLAFDSLSRPAVLNQLILREADLPSHRPDGKSLLNIISQMLVAHLPHLGPNSLQLVLLLEALRQNIQLSTEDNGSLSQAALLSSLLREEEAVKQEVKMEVDGNDAITAASPNQQLIASFAETLFARALLVTQDALFEALSASGLRDRYLDHPLSNDGKLEKLAFLYHLRPHIEPLASLALQAADESKQNASDDEASSLFELLLVLIGVEGGQKCAGDILRHLFGIAQSPSAHSLSVFLRVRSRFLNYYPDVYRECVESVVEASQTYPDDRLFGVLANFCFLLRADETASSPLLPSLSTAALLARHWAQLFAFVYRPAFVSVSSAAAAPLPPVLFPLLEATITHLAAGDATQFHTCIEQIILYFLALLPSSSLAPTTDRETDKRADAIPPIEAVKRLIVKMADASPESALPHILDFIFDFVFSPEADGIVRRKREVIRAAKPLRPPSTSATPLVGAVTTPPVLPAPVSKSVYVPPANTIFQPTTSLFSAISLFSPSHPSFSAAKPVPNSTLPSSHPSFSAAKPVPNSTLPSSSSYTAPSSTTAQLRGEPGAAVSTSLLDQNLKRRAHDRKDSRTSLSIFEKTLIKKRKLGFDTDSSHYQDKVLLEAMLLQDNQRHILDLLSLCVHHNDMDRVDVLADLYLARLIRTQDPTPTYEQYKEVLPRRPTFPRDQFVQKIFTQNPILVPILELIAREPSILYRCLEVIRSLMVYTISHWHAELTPDPKKSAEFGFTCRLLELLRSAKWVPAPLCYCGEVFGEITPEEITTILLAVWDFLHHSPPSPTHYFASSYESKPQQGDDKRQSVTCNVDPFMRTLRNVLRQNVGKLSNNYARFF